MRRIAAGLLGALLAFSPAAALAAPAQALQPAAAPAVQSREELPYLYDTLPDGTISIRRYLGTGAGHVWVPGRLDEKTVTAIGEQAFRFANMSAVTLPDSIRAIGQEAFSGCPNLTEITIPEGVEVLSIGLFQESPVLARVILPDSLKEISQRAFYDCPELSRINLPSGLQSIGNEAFAQCPALTSIHLPDHLQTLATSAFRYCTGLKKVSIPGSVLSLGNSAFENCTALERADISQGVHSIGSQAFAYCAKLKTVVLPPTLASIGISAFNVPAPLDVYFGGNRTQWARIRVGNGNSALVDGNIAYDTTGPAGTDVPGGELQGGVTVRPDSGLRIVHADTRNELIGLTVRPAATAVRIGALLRMFVIPAGITGSAWRGEGVLHADDIVATGDTVRFGSGSDYLDTLHVLVAGDVLGTGVLNVAQVARLAQAINGTQPLRGPYLQAADVNGSGSLDISDLVREAHLLTGS